MDAVRTLMENYWIHKEKDRDLYAKTRREAGEARRFFAEQLGWNLVNNERILKLEKIPARAESFMGITEFTEVRDYCIFCALLIFLEDKEDGEQFLLSELVAMIEAQLQGQMEVDWTMFTQRKSLVRVLKFAESRGLVAVYDGSSDRVSGGMEQEVLYENTGLSRYFAVNFGYSIAEFSSYRDFENAGNGELETDRGYFRIQRVYRQLAACPAMYWDRADDADALYLKNQRQWVGKYLDDYLGGRLEIHRNAAFFVLDEEDTFGECHPKESGAAEAVLSFCAFLRERIAGGRLAREENDCVTIPWELFERLLFECRAGCGAGWSKEFREMSGEKLLEAVSSYMESWMLIRMRKDAVVLLPAAGKLTGKYPEDFLRQEKNIDFAGGNTV